MEFGNTHKLVWDVTTPPPLVAGLAACLCLCVLCVCVCVCVLCCRCPAGVVGSAVIGVPSTIRAHPTDSMRRFRERERGDFAPY